MTIEEWKEEFARAVDRKYPNKWGPQDRLLSLFRQVGDASGAIQVKEGILKGGNPKFKNVPHRLAAIFPDLFVLCAHYGVDMEDELDRVMDFFRPDAEKRYK